MMQTTVPTEKIVMTLTALIGACQTISLAFRDAADGLFSPSMKALFRDYSVAWMRFVGDLQIELSRYDSDSLERSMVITAGSDTDQSSNQPNENQNNNTGLAAISNAPQTIFELDKALKTGNEIAIVSACLYGESVVLDMYVTALKQDFPASLFHLLHQQHTEIESLREKLRVWRDPQNLSSV